MIFEPTVRLFRHHNFSTIRKKVFPSSGCKQLSRSISLLQLLNLGFYPWPNSINWFKCTTRIDVYTVSDRLSIHSKLQVLRASFLYSVWTLRFLVKKPTWSEQEFVFCVNTFKICDLRKFQWNIRWAREIHQFLSKLRWRSFRVFDSNTTVPSIVVDTSTGVRPRKVSNRPTEVRTANVRHLSR